MKKKIAIIEDEPDISELLVYNLEKEGYAVIRSFDGGEGLKLIRQERPDLILLDLMLPGMDGLEICQALKQDEQTRHIPIVMITAKSEESDVIVGLQMGADDYVTKPFSPKVVLARVKAAFRRNHKGQTADAAALRNFGQLTLDLPKYKVVVAGDPVSLTTIEFAILEFLSRTPGRVYTRDQILDSVWKEGKFIIDRAVDVHVRGLRKKLGRAADFVETVRGVGYRFKDVE
jgi:two-component system, OmpR family, alkaline phosphatase synthesis response regulator PhoP